MVGIPLSRGCQPCRRRKVKCDEKRPACLRCTISNLVCPGYPIRLKFIDEGPRFKGNPCTPQSSPEQSLPLSLPGSSSENLSFKLCQTFRPDLPVVKSVATLSKDTFVTELPRHVGLSLACDLAMRALCLAHDTILNPENPVLVQQSRIQYSQALTELQLCVADLERATTMGTICAAMLLSMFELLCADFGASIRHAGGASRLIEASGPHQFKDPFAYRMLHTLQGPIVVECILYRRRCFLDAPLWRDVCRRIQSPFNTLFSRLSRLPNILCALRELESISTGHSRERTSLSDQIVALRNDLQKWRDAPGHAELFCTTTCPSTEFFEFNLNYTSRNAAELLCTYAAMMILLNSALLVLSHSKIPLYKLQNLMLAKQICQSYEYSRVCSPVGSLAMDFAFRVAYVVPDASQKKWIVEKMNEMASPLGGPRHTDVEETELESCFDYLKC
ncbi:conserved hypothetical protein [Talaromyces stipitatus ATCC 10500]|uniref:Zn(2)-C6 fungal-type domain-containing protein n=1 Tax=Talaromyces stipitatus (strain ATCC 10500 / CBS 375.48 / QM 6759 / NRRL 1006) TaxID=441959 RepID=B8LZM5_TALSN|nr:uncharacterized protein TSTA_096970 [Talaromyces stipitatus ATCC 10500]EED22448.1 conserved hypothetical protein [Talaromyces stipitatus ATCC 10500]